MGMVIHDDFWEAAQAMPEKQRAPFIYALVEYRFTGKEPSGKPAWLPAFLVVKNRLDLGDEASNKGRRAARARWDKQKVQNECPTDAQAHANAHANAYAHAYAPAYAPAHAQAYAEHECDAYTQAQNCCNAEVEYEKEIEIPPYSPPLCDSTCTSFNLECLKALNDTLGTAYTTLPSKCANFLDRFEGTYSVDEVKAMVAYKRDEWKGTRFKRSLTPNTLFSPDHFEQYMHQSKDQEVTPDAFEAYE